MLSTFYEFPKKGTSCRCADTNQICVLLPFPTEPFCVLLFLRNKNYVQLILIFKKYIYVKISSNQRQMGNW